MRARVKPTTSTWLLVLLALVLSGIIAWVETRDRTARSAAPAADDGDYTVEVELVPESDE